jgi:HEAT repeat protein
LSAALRSEDMGMRQIAAWALGQIGDRRAIKPLEAALRDSDSDVRESAASSLERIRSR